ncbi:MAG TPA: hypothetical protein VGH23_12010 [Rhizomicrobium sp.]|jgi:hypothetical protein
MSQRFRAGTAFVFTTLMTGRVPSLDPRRRAVASGVAHAGLEGQLKAEILSSFLGGRG